ncbi:MAG TPA: hypothetical protein VIS29_02985, partial [Streptomyces sp.]
AGVAATRDGPASRCQNDHSSRGTSRGGVRAGHAAAGDLGECVVVAHGVNLQEQGHDVTLLMDDHGGRTIAAQHGLTYATIEDVLALAVDAGCFASLQDLTKAYERLQEFGSGLPAFRHTHLGDAFRTWTAS